ncbi:hypothetical protein MMAG44476_33022 [Mycolicibacterium mageritense DSM 44476 = CIP 104973]|uniref:Keratin associated protein n=1 Tax=Mycolicibacterium mageritense TaxID=53462 RepID=A0AAI8XL44_MYCME|nr:hypothetical protein [Mycolicibacterium mageritense]MBN3457224.1 hypothetical protein [Mycobacterium sp. DSM 3803]TXI54677.1 MAG: hypothetical protein E6Q55_32375 [Mycolicibacterium mageritense]CDO25111.1 hypothetical protein BN978_05612 [Mycolicibacterium mageritense DSM 44476 = CIP 104973]BBX31365.1 hypothetical protein MMAGJ_06470 [Mycolicibacterium mageritense]BDY26486.1 hypothetical protein hbim_00398 [Mycolicibacterium mageritense]
MRITPRHFAPLLAAGAGAIAIAVAPVAAAAPPVAQQACSSFGDGTECQSPGNVQINDSTPPDFEAQYPYFSLFGLGGNYGHGFNGGGGHGFGGGGHR